MKIYPPQSPLGKGGCQRQGGVYKIDVSIENQRFTTLTWKTKKTVYHNFHKPMITEMLLYRRDKY